MSNSPLPPPTALLTALFTSLPPLPPTTAPLPSNPLLSAPPSTKSLFLTLHALFPNEFLPALDLLDRGLVTRVVIRQEEDRGGEEQACFLSNTGSDAECRRPREREGEGEGDGAAGARGSGPRGENEDEGSSAEDRDGDRRRHGERSNHDIMAKGPRARNAVYYVHSAASTAQRPGRSRYAWVGEKSYEVRLRAWNCSCPAFTFSAFSSTPRASVVPSARQVHVDVDVGDAGAKAAAEGEDVVDGGGEGDEWVFGGLSSLWAAGEETVPVCKHLLACVVGERCGLLGGFVAERVVGLGEAAGLGAGWGG